MLGKVRVENKGWEGKANAESGFCEWKRTAGECIMFTRGVSPTKDAYYCEAAWRWGWSLRVCVYCA